jgi:hypothetical protein
MTMSVLVQLGFWMRSRRSEEPAILKELRVNILGSLKKGSHYR